MLDGAGRFGRATLQDKVRCVELNACKISPQSLQIADYARPNQAISCSLQVQHGDTTPQEFSGDINRQRLSCAFYQDRRRYQAYSGKCLAHENVWRVGAHEQVAQEEG